jgi:hypothetical protein
MVRRFLRVNVTAVQDPRVYLNAKPGIGDPAPYCDCTAPERNLTSTHFVTLLVNAQFLLLLCKNYCKDKPSAAQKRTDDDFGNGLSLPLHMLNRPLSVLSERLRSARTTPATTTTSTASTTTSTFEPSLFTTAASTELPELPDEPPPELLEQLQDPVAFPSLAIGTKRFRFEDGEGQRNVPAFVKASPLIAGVSLFAGRCSKRARGETVFCGFPSPLVLIGGCCCAAREPRGCPRRPAN